MAESKPKIVIVQVNTNRKTKIKFAIQNNDTFEDLLKKICGFLKADFTKLFDKDGALIVDRRR
jgi:hypothetical protein